MGITWANINFVVIFNITECLKLSNVKILLEIVVRTCNQNAFKRYLLKKEQPL